MSELEINLLNAATKILVDTPNGPEAQDVVSVEYALKLFRVEPSKDDFMYSLCALGETRLAPEPTVDNFIKWFVEVHRGENDE